ncbi:indole-3-glycerol phosphate synthase TrpC [Bacillus shivajii]|nr:indole-3-glycerol phosphate synthase TrpC [Bacillus shivajii]
MLDTIVEKKKEEVENLSSFDTDSVPYPHRSLYEALKEPNRDLGIISEVKKASPSKGVLSTDFHSVKIAEEYEQINVDAISVLTDKSFFKGDISHLTEVKKNVSVPILRKDFIIDDKQIFESKAIGADAILLIAAILSKKQLKEYMNIAEEQHLDVLVEVHNEQELEDVLSVTTPKLIGVNNRNLKTFETSIETSENLSEYIPKSSLFISESGIQTRNDINRLKEMGANGMLVGETFMRSKNKRGIIDEWFTKEASL